MNSTKHERSLILIALEFYQGRVLREDAVGRLGDLGYTYKESTDILDYLVALLISERTTP